MSSAHAPLTEIFHKQIAFYTVLGAQSLTEITV